MIVLYNPPSSPTRKPVLPLSLLALGAVLEGNHEYAIVDGNLEADPAAALTALVQRDRVPILAVTVMPGPQLCDAVPLCRQLKEAFPGLVIVWGGYFPTQHAETCLASGFVDYVIRGHGERVFGRLVDRLKAGEDSPRLPEVAGGDRPGRLAEMPDPERLPDFPYQRLRMDRYLRRTFLGGRTLSHHSSYGCPFRCNFCAVVNLAEGRWRAQSARRVARTVGRLHGEFGADAVEFMDNNFFVSEARVVEFAERVRGLGVGWWGEARVDTLLGYRDASWQLMREAGLKMVFMGAESASDQVLQRMDKGGTAAADKTLEIAGQARRFGIVPEFSFIVGNPPDPEGDAAATLQFVRRVKRVNPASEIVLYQYTPVPLSGALYEAARAEGFSFPETLEEWVSPQWLDFSLRRSSRLPWLERGLRRRLRNFERVLNAYYPTSTDLALSPARRRLLRAVSAWRYRLGVYDFPLELRLLQRLFRYQRPETSGF